MVRRAWLWRWSYPTLCLSVLTSGCASTTGCKDLVQAVHDQDQARLDRLLLQKTEPDCSCFIIDGPWMGEGRTWRSTSPLIEAVRQHDRSACLSLLRAGADPNYVPDGESTLPIVFATRPRWGYDQIIACDLLEYGADPLRTIRGERPVLEHLVYVGLFPVLQAAIDQLLQDGRCQDLKPHLETLASRVDTPSMLYRTAYLAGVSRYCDRAAAGEEKWQSVDHLMASILHNEKESVAALLRADSSLVDQRTALGWTPLTWALLCADADVCDSLLQVAGAQSGGLAQTTSWGATPLHCAAHSGRAEIVRSVLDVAPSLINAVDDDGVSALSIAVQEGPADVITVLLDNGADPEIGRLRGKSPQDRLSH